MSESPSPPMLCHVRVLYLGSAVPLDTAVGIESIQKPCHERYLRDRNDQKTFGIDVNLTVYGSGLMMSYLVDNTTQSWFPISTLNVCAAVKAVDVDGSRRFESLDNLTVWNSRNPPLFAYEMHRSVDAKVLECHVFQCSKNEDAMSLVQSSMYAYEHKQSWLNCRPTIPPNILLQISQMPILPASTGSAANNSFPPSECTNKYRDKIQRDVDLHPTDVDTNLNDSCRFNTYLKYTPSIVGQRNGFKNAVESSITNIQNSTQPQQLIPVINQLNLNYPVMMQMNPSGAPRPISQHLTPCNLLPADAKPIRQRKPRTRRTRKNRLTNESDGDSSSEEEEIFYVKRSELNNVYQNDHLFRHHARETIEQEHGHQLPGTRPHKPTQTASLPTSRPSSYYSVTQSSKQHQPSQQHAQSQPSQQHAQSQLSQQHAQSQPSQQHAQSAQTSTDFVIYAPQNERSTNSSVQREFDKHTSAEFKRYDTDKPRISDELNQVSTNKFVTPSPQNNEYYNLNQVSVQTLLHQVTPAIQHKGRVLKRYDVCATGDSDHGTYLRSRPINVPQPVNIDKLECGVYERRLPTETKLSETVSSTFEAALPKSKINYTQLADGLGYFP